ncbi:MAG: glycosyltransferase family 2 protein [Candidatus Sulfotelmatobacter sp.]
MDLSIIVINWNSAGFVRKCLQSVYAGTTGCEFEVIVVDNASFDECGEIVRNEFPAAKFIQSDLNLGFARANNLGARETTGRNLLFLNPDTEIVGDALLRMVSFLDTQPDAGLVGCKLLNTDLSLQTSCVQAFPSLLNQALDNEHLRRVFPNLRLWGMQALLTDGKPAEVEVVAGACLMIKSEVFEAIGQFSSNYFMYAEDADLCFKVKQAGWKNHYLSGASVVHHGGQSSGKKPESNFASIMMRESLLEFMRLRRGSLYAIAYQLTTIVIAVLRLLLLMVAFVFTLGGEKRKALRPAFAKWVKVLRWGLRMEAWSKQAT